MAALAEWRMAEVRLAQRTGDDGRSRCVFSERGRGRFPGSGRRGSRERTSRSDEFGGAGARYVHGSSGGGRGDDSRSRWERGECGSGDGWCGDDQSSNNHSGNFGAGGAGGCDYGDSSPVRGGGERGGCACQWARGRNSTDWQSGAKRKGA